MISPVAQDVPTRGVLGRYFTSYWQLCLSLHQCRFTIQQWQLRC